MESSQEDWVACTLCRTIKEGRKVLKKAKVREVEWREPNPGLFKSDVPDPVIYTSLEDAFDSMMHFMRMSSVKCGRYHKSHRPHGKGSQSLKHTQKFHASQSINKQPSAIIENPIVQPTNIRVDTVPGSYSITTSRAGESSCHPSTKHVVKVKPGEVITLTLTV